MWLPVSDLFSSVLARIQVLMLQNDIERMQADPNFSLDSSDGVYIVFEPDLQRCIGVDVRYMLFIMEKYGKAANLIEELKLTR